MARAPQQNKSLPGLAPDYKLFAIARTKGINTKDSRPDIDDEELSWQENWMRIGNGNLRTVYDIGDSLYTAGGGLTIIFFFPFNIGSTFYMAVFLSDGTAVQVRQSDGAVTTISAVANTFWQTGRERPGCSQWGSQYLLIVTKDGYWIWDGALLYGPGTLSPAVQITRAGSGYTSAPTVTAHGGAGSGATFTATVSGGFVTKITVTNPGTGYIATDVVALDFTGGGGSTTAIITPTLTGTKVTGLTITNGGTGYGNGGTTPVPILTIVGGGGSGATAHVSTMVAGVITAVVLDTQGDGYTSVPTVLVTSATTDSNKLAEARVNIMPIGLTGTAIETYQSRVWITDKDNGSLKASAPASFDNFAASAGGVGATSTDNFLRVGFPAIKQANGYLYPFGDSSIQVISNVQSGGSPVTTIFNNTNTDPQVGTPWRDTVQAFGRALMFANEVGIYALFGGTAEKQSDKLDGIILALPHRHTFTDISEPSACLASIFDIRVYCCLIPIIDPFNGVLRNALMVWDGRSWFVGSQTKPLTFVGTSWSDASQPEPWGTDGMSIFPIFNQASGALTKILQTKLWAGTSFIVTKQALELALQVEDKSGQGFVLNSTIDMVGGLNPEYPLQASSQATFVFVNNTGQVFGWQNNSLQEFDWAASGQSITRQGIDSAYANLLGLTAVSSSPDFVLIQAAIGYRDYTAVGGA